ncbi:TPA: hypothetical protein N2C61_006461 [Pseudomonas aeruginosa]|uniref:hypothetical protein n=1 Tax=Alcaligenes xylosoxydans xylosoxydans TaxID=85698 RepID=UPI000695D8A2|nr:hypothetical protein [Achromobacter xylosoxidans]HCL4135296.1 hypothetical protein [Pseudomonas aeruginosa]
MLQKVQENTVATAWATLPDVEDVVPRSAADEVIFQEIRAVLERHGALDRFGLMLNHRHFDLQPGEVIFETTDVESRRQIIEPRAAQDVLGSGRVLETQWMFGRGDTLFCVGFCDYNNGHKRIHNRK